MKRRTLLKLLGAGAIAGTGAAYWPDEGVWNPCLDEKLPAELFDLVQQAWQGINSRYYIDSHLHIVGTGDSPSGIWLHPDMQNPLQLAQYIRFKFYMNAACVQDGQSVDEGYVKYLLQLHSGFPAGAKFMLLAFDYRHDEQGQALKDKSPFAIPNEYAARLVERYPEKFEWAASIHPYRKDSVEKLDWSVRHGARAVKWLPPMMDIDPSSKRCEAFYEDLVKHDIPLLSHAGDEHAVAGVDTQKLGNPLLLRKPLEHGVKVIVAHCATMGSNRDIDQGTNGPEVSNYQLFARLMNEPRYEGLLFGDISAIPQVNRDESALADIISQQHWHHRLLHGSDFPLPGVMPVFSAKRIANLGLLDANKVEQIQKIRHYNPILYDFVLKRNMRFKGLRLSNSIFESGRILTKQI